MLRRIAKLENDRYLGIEALKLMGRKVPGRIEDQPVNAGVQYNFFRNQIGDPAIFASGSFASNSQPPATSTSRVTGTPAAGRPCAVSRICVVIALTG